MNNNKLIIGIDASRNRSGGAKAHIIGIINALKSETEKSFIIHIWSYKTLLKSLPDLNFVVKHTSDELEKNIFSQIIWQYFKLPKLVKEYKCDILLYTDAGAFINFHPCVVMSRDMLSFEKGEMNRYPFSISKLRLLILKYIQIHSLKNAEGVIFLTNYASEVIQKHTGILNNVRIIPHGVSNYFRVKNDLINNYIVPNSNELIKCIYVSNTAPYKHQWNVVKAIKILRNKGYNLNLTLVGGGNGPAQLKLEREINISDPNREFVKQIEFVQHNQISDYLFKSHIFIFASSCENMPNTLIEGMASGLIIACSNRGPMPEVLKDAGVYFDPENPNSISNAILNILNNPTQNSNRQKLSIQYSKEYSWERCVTETFEYLQFTRDIAKNN